MDFKSNRITLFLEQYEAISKLPVSIQGKVYKAVIDYNFTGIMPKLDTTAQLAFDLIKPSIDMSLTKQRAGQAGGYQKATNGVAECKQDCSSDLADSKQTLSKDVAGAKQRRSRSVANAKQTDSKDIAEVKQELSKSVAEGKQDCSSDLAAFSLPFSPTPPLTNSKSLSIPKYTRECVPPIIPQGIFTPPQVEEVIAVGREIGLSEQSCRDYYNYYSAQNWLLNSGLPMDNWKSGLERWRRTEGKFTQSDKKGAERGYERNYTKQQLDSMLGDTENFDDIEL